MADSGQKNNYKRKHGRPDGADASKLLFQSASKRPADMRNDDDNVCVKKRRTNSTAQMSNRQIVYLCSCKAQEAKDRNQHGEAGKLIGNVAHITPKHMKLDNGGTARSFKYNEAGSSFENDGDYLQAAKHYRMSAYELRQSARDNPSARKIMEMNYVKAAQAYDKAGHYFCAAACYQESIKCLDADDSEWAIKHATAAASLYDLASNNVKCAATQDINGDYVDRQNCLRLAAECYSTAGHNAALLDKKSCRKPSKYYTLAAQYSREAGLHTEAVEYYKLAADNVLGNEHADNAEKATLYYNMAKCYATISDRENAAHLYRIAAESMPEEGSIDGSRTCIGNKNIYYCMAAQEYAAIGRYGISGVCHENAADCCSKGMQGFSLDYELCRRTVNRYGLAVNAYLKANAPLAAAECQAKVADCRRTGDAKISGNYRGAAKICEQHRYFDEAGKYFEKAASFRTMTEKLQDGRPFRDLDLADAVRCYNFAGLCADADRCKNLRDCNQYQYDDISQQCCDVWPQPCPGLVIADQYTGHDASLHCMRNCVDMNIEHAECNLVFDNHNGRQEICAGYDNGDANDKCAIHQRVYMMFDMKIAAPQDLFCSKELLECVHEQTEAFKQI